MKNPEVVFWLEKENMVIFVGQILHPIVEVYHLCMKWPQTWIFVLSMDEWVILSSHLTLATRAASILQAFLIFNTVYRLPGVTYAELPNFMLPELLCLIKLNNEKQRVDDTRTHKEWNI